jgi:hypothetical protein
MEQARRPIRDLVSLGGRGRVRGDELVSSLVDMHEMVLPFFSGLSVVYGHEHA